MKIPPILLEGDRPSAPPPSGPGKRYALGPESAGAGAETPAELPEAYGTRQLLLAARDPHWLYAHWDLTREQQIQYNNLSTDRHLVLRIHHESLHQPPATEIHVHPESRHWFAHVDRAGSKYLAVLGYYAKSGQWKAVAASGATLTPPETLSPDSTAEFATIPLELPFARLVALVKSAAIENVPLAEALEELKAKGHPDLPDGMFGEELPAWTAAQEQALARVVSMDHVRRVWIGSLEITELVRRQWVQELASMAAAQLEMAGPLSSGAIFSPSGAGPGRKGFWFNINAELIIYGATDPTASVTIGGRSIRLRPDGSFSYRFALPDGEFELPTVAVSEDRTDGRGAELRFSRHTEYHGEVGAHPQDQGLRRPEPQNI